MFTVVKRLIELFGLCVALSSLIGGLVYFEMIEDTRYQCGVLMMLAVAVFVYLNVIMLRKAYYYLANKKQYYLYNYAVYAMFIAVNAAVFLWGNGTLYGFMFGITKFVNHIVFFQEYRLGTILSAAFFHIIMILAITFAPYGMDWVFLLKEEEETDDAEIARIISESSIQEGEFENALIK